MPQPICFFPTDLATDLDPLSMDERGIYLTFVRHGWPYGGPMPTDEVEALIGKPWLSCSLLLQRRFVENDGHLTLPWMEEKRAEAAERSLAASIKGKLGGRPRKKKKLRKSRSLSTAKPQQSYPDGNGIGNGNDLGIEERKTAFAEKCRAVIEADPERLDVDERAGFYAYWTEPDTKGVMRFEAQKFFDHGRRMDTWTKNKADRANV